MPTTSAVPSLVHQFGFSVQDHSGPTARGFWATVTGTSQVPYTIKADRIDLEDFAQTLDTFEHYKTEREFFRALSDDSWEQFVYMFIDHLMQHERVKGEVHRWRMAIFSRIMEIIAPDAGDPSSEFYTHTGFKVAGHTLDLFARKVETNANYQNQFGSFRVWIESKDIKDMDSLLKVYVDIAVNYVVRGCQN